ncbi:MAG: hypothetical protein KC777_14820 [Cyanobacteria bacterium HKST-UBA02]|nr:hypothetical protein [Cyanobacteria bacterium HKST-UBA02]
MIRKEIWTVSVLSVMLLLLAQPGARAEEDNRNEDNRKKARHLLAVGLPLLRDEEKDLPSGMITPKGEELAHIIGIIPQLEHIDRLKETITKLDPDKDEDLVDKLMNRLDRITTTVSQRILRASLEVDYCTSEIDFEQERDDFLLAELGEKEDRKLLWANRINAVANASLWTISGILTLPAYRQPRLSVPTGITTIVAGTVPGALELITLQIPTVNRIHNKSRGNLLAYVMGMASAEDFSIPASVDRYLSSIPPDTKDKLNRKTILINAWVSAKLMPPEDSRDSEKYRLLLTDYRDDKTPLKREHLQRRIMMLNHLKVAVFNMKRGLLELMQGL